MADMANARPEQPTQDTLPQFQLTAWYTRRGAAEEIGCHVKTLDRMVKDGRITGHQPHGGENEDVPVLFYAPDVYELAQARKRLRP